MKIENDKYYTDDIISKHCIDFLGEEFFKNITEIIEPSAGGGSFIRALETLNLSIPIKAYDIDPSCENTETADFLKLKMDYKPGRLVIGNPPFGRSNHLTISFLNKSFKISDYVAFIVPSSTESSVRVYAFDKYKVLRLGKVFKLLSKASVSFIIYKRPADGKLKQRPPLPFDTFTSKVEGAKMLIHSFTTPKTIHCKSTEAGGTPQRLRDLVKVDDIITCSFGTGCFFKNAPLGTYNRELVIRIYDKDIHEYVKRFLIENGKSLNVKFKERYSRTTHLQSTTIYEIISDIIAASKEHL